MSVTSVFILGASVSGIALATALGKEAVLLDDGMLIGKEYIAGLHAQPYDPDPICLPETQSLCKDLIARGLLRTDGRYHLPPIQGLLAQRLADSGATVRFYTRVMSIQTAENGYLVTIFDAEGFHMLEARQIVDTRPDERGQKQLCAMLFGARDMSLPVSDPRMRLLPGALEDEWILSFDAPTGADYAEARTALHACWQVYASQPGNALRMASVAPVWTYTYAAPVDEADTDGIVHCISASFGNVLAAYEGGLHCALRLCDVACQTQA